MLIFHNKKIILAITPDVNLYSCIEENLKHLGFTVYLISPIKDFKYKNLKDRLINFYRRKILNDKEYKRILNRKFHFDNISKKISNLPNVDYSLTIRVDLFEAVLIEKITKLSLKNYAYQWDGLSRFKEAIKLIPLFNKFYVFDKKDLNQDNKTYPTTNFYIDCYDYLFQTKTIEYDAYYIGSYDNRIDKLISICEILYKKGFKLNIILCCSPKKHLKKYPYIKFIGKRLTYFENLKMVANSRFIIDTHHDSLHSGLSFRTFEALGYNKKLITTNPIIKNYDFYNTNNIFYVNEHNDYNLIDDFLNSNYKEINPLIKQKYSFTNWIKYILEIKENIPINIP